MKFSHMIPYCMSFKSCLIQFSVKRNGKIQGCQKAALAIIYDKKYKSYGNALTISGLQSLEDRRKEICVKFAKKALKNPKYQHWFIQDENSFNTRSKKPFLKPVSARTSRFEKSPIAYLTKLLNNATG